MNGEPIFLPQGRRKPYAAGQKQVSYTEFAYYYVELMLWYNKIYFFVLRKGTNGNAKGRVLQCKTRPFGNVLILNELRAGS